jgi:hypothetical protein
MYTLEPLVPTSKSPLGSAASSRAPATFATVLDAKPPARLILASLGGGVAPGEADEGVSSPSSETVSTHIVASS